MTEPGAVRRYLDDKRHPLLILGGAAAAIAVLVIGSELVGDDDAARQGPWTAGPTETTCRDYVEQMTSEERASMAELSLLAMRTKDSLPMTRADVTDDFAAGIANVCDGTPSMTVSDAAIGIYVTERDRFAG